MSYEVACAPKRAPATRCRAANGSNQASVNWQKMFTPGSVAVPDEPNGPTPEPT